MASGKPLVVCSPVNTPIVNFLKDTACAKIVTASDATAKANEIARWLASVTKQELQEMGERGLAEIRGKYSKDVVTKQYCQLVEKL